MGLALAPPAALCETSQGQGRVKREASRMNVDSLRKALPQVKTPADVDKLMTQVRDGGGLDATERAELVKAADGFDDPTKQRMLTHLSALGQANAWVNVDAGSNKVTTIQGRYANLKLDVPGI